MPYDIVRPLKFEAKSRGGTQNDTDATELNPLQDALAVSGIALQDTTGTTLDQAVLIDRLSARLRLADSTTSRLLSELVCTPTGQQGSHNALLDVIHFLADGPGDGFAKGACAIDTYNGPLLLNTVWFTDETQAKRIVAVAWTYTGPLIATEKMTLYAADGTTVVRTVTDTYSYNGPLRSKRVRTWGTT